MIEAVWEWFVDLIYRAIDWLGDHMWVTFALVAVLIAGLVAGVAIYSAQHQCHGNGHYYWTTQCISTGKSIVCYPVRLEETVCDKP